MFSQPPRPEDKEVAPDSYSELQSQGEDLGYTLTPKALDTEPTPNDLLQAAGSYAQAALGSGAEVNTFSKVSDKPETWNADISNGKQRAVLVAVRVPGGYNFYVEGATGSTEGKW
ncbi:hypothetical protein [Candidatus Cyanaurora vandensis]|uniref:hypothetical protein n=1 Tax=Candidatus Cyanaurora vandensis TaxID=2714958 RepID=UPI00257A2BA3|nr:hypothetical protein [Candidatus Cyanaurora vandensis]